MLKQLNKDFGKFVCWFLGKHREPHQTEQTHVWKVEFCNRCGHIFKKEKIGRTFNEIWKDVYFNSGNQIW